MPDKIACSLWGDDVGSGVGGLPPRSALAVKEFVWFGVGELCPFFESQLSDYRIVKRCSSSFQSLLSEGVDRAHQWHIEEWAEGESKKRELMQSEIPARISCAGLTARSPSLSRSNKAP